MVVRSDWLVGGDRRHRGLRADLCRGDRCHCAWRSRGPRHRRVGLPGSLLPRDDLPPCRRQDGDPRCGAASCRRPDHRDGAARGLRFERCRTDRYRDHGGAQRDSNRSARSADGHLDSRSRRWRWLTDSPIVAGFATDLNGLTDDDPEAAQWIIRIVLSLHVLAHRRRRRRTPKSSSASSHPPSAREP